MFAPRHGEAAWPGLESNYSLTHKSIKTVQNKLPDEILATVKLDEDDTMEEGKAVSWVAHG